MDPIPEKIPILGVTVSNLMMDQAVRVIVDRGTIPEPFQVCFLNADCSNLAARNPEYREVLGRCRMVLADGIGIRMAAWIDKQRIKDNINGTDMFPKLCEALSGTGQGIYFFGGRRGVVEGLMLWVRKHHPGVTISGGRHGYFEPQEESRIIDDIRRSGASILLVAFGAPRQDLWIARHLSELGVKVAIGVGGLFDFYSGRIPRAPLWMRRAGLEWFFRLLQEPGRLWKRYLIGNPVFILRSIRRTSK